jgi:hypothetical protein
MLFKIINVETGETLETCESGAEAAKLCRTSYADTRTRILQEAAPAPAVEMVWFWGYGFPFSDSPWYGFPFSDSPGYRPAGATVYRAGDGTVHALVPADGAAWRRREARICEETYNRIPWRGEPWWLESPHVGMHYPRPSGVDSAQIAYTPDETHGQEDRQLRTRPGRYLTKYFSDVLSPAEIESWSLAWATEFAPASLKLAYAADDIEYVFENGPSSCMSGSASRFSSDVHPVRVYAGPDLAVAYITNGGERIAARAVVWPDRKLHSRIYGDHARLEDALRAEGYTGGSLNGARIQCIEDSSGGYVMPHIDGAYAVEGPLHDSATGQEYFIINSGGTIRADNTNGLAGEDRMTCDNCGDGLAEGEECYPQDGDGTYCEHCYHDLFTYCERCSRSDVPSDEARYVEAENGALCDDCYSEHYANCACCGDEKATDETTVPDTGRYRYDPLCSDCYFENYTECEECGDETATGDTVYVETDEIVGHVCQHCAEEHEGAAVAAPCPPVRAVHSTDPAQLAVL